jgi:glutamine synthetase
MTTAPTSEGGVVAVEEAYKPDADRITHVKSDLEQQGVRYCYAAYVDIHGIPKAKATPIQAFEKMCAGKELYTVGAVDGLGLNGPHEDECATIPDLDSGVVLPWDSSQAWFHANLFYRGQPYVNDPRTILQHHMERARAKGLQFNLGIEPEFYVLKEDPDTGQLRPITETQFKGANACYDLRLTSESLDFLDPMNRYMEQLGWGLFSFDQECGRGQHEFDFGYCDAVTMADRFIFFRMMAKKVAQSIGAFASFMPKPFDNDFRSGAHFNMSLADPETGQNLFEPDPGYSGQLAETYGIPVSDIAYHFSAGVLKHADAICALSCPTFNSYQGLIAQGSLADFSWAPVLVTYGRNNRSAMLRLPANRACVENRAVDMAVNPYLAAALTLAAGLEGIEQQLDPGDPLNTDLYKLTEAGLKEQGIRKLPPTLLHAIEAFEADPLVEEALGHEFKGIFIQQKRHEWEQQFYRVSDAQRKDALTFI